VAGLHAEDLSLHGIDLADTTISIDTIDMYNALGFPGQWYIGDLSGSPVGPRGVTDRVNYSTLQSYLRTRDQLRVKGGRPPIWEHDSTMEHAADVYQLKTAADNVATTKVRIIYDKGWHGGNRAKDESLSIDEKSLTGKCRLCNQQDSAAHWLHMCPARAVTMVRDSIFQTLQQEVTRYREKSPLHRQLGYSFQNILKTTAEPHRIWTSNWSQQQIQQLANSVPPALLAPLTLVKLQADSSQWSS
jgi:hypothetical protein